MAGWVSDQDRDLLVPGAKHNLGEGMGSWVAPPSTPLVGNVTAYSDISTQVRAFDQGRDAVEMNPYLDFQTPVFEESVSRAPNHIIPLQTVESMERSSLELNPTPRSPTPVSPLNNRDDEAVKYFPQLKQF